MLPPSTSAQPEAIKIKAYPSTPQRSSPGTTLVQACAVQPSYTLRSFEPAGSDEEEKAGGVHVSREQVRHVDYAASRSTLNEP